MTDLETRSGIRVRELLNTPHLGLTLLAGAGGLDRRVTWTHVSELEQPEIWLDGGELLIATGLGIPPDREGQEAFLTGLESKRAAGLALGVRGPSIFKEVIELADELDFPILAVAAAVPFLAIARLVADFNQDRAQRRMATHIRIFDTLREGCDAADAPELIERLEDISGYELFVMTPRGQPLLPGLEHLPPAVAEAIEFWEPERGNQSFPGGYIVPIPIDRRNAGFLVALERATSEQAGLGAVRHMATIMALLVTNVYRERELERRRGAELLGRLMGGSAESEETIQLLHGTGLEAGPLTMVKLRGPQEAIDELYHRACDLRIPHLLMSDRDDALLVMEEAEETLLSLANDLALVGGASSSFAPESHWVLARSEAEKALDRAIGEQRGFGSVVLYSSADSPLEWLPTDPSVLEALSREVLQPLRDYDLQNSTSLIDSLRVYFEKDRRLSVAAEALFVHKHTLAYRLKRIEELTGRKLSRMDDLCVVYLALKASAVSAAGEAASSGVAAPA